ncbi:MAG: response regulator transcription factor [Ignavibacteria bacterium]|nr:response regulator transcription factor [Ignavibacteria bacterium]
MSKSILLIEDDSRLCELLNEFLFRNNYKVSYFEKPSDAFVKLRNNYFDIIILDVMLPEMNGFEVLKKIRKDYRTPVIMLTARGELNDKILGLELGADDYLPKPFEPRELLARIQSVLRRSESKADENQIIEINDLVIDTGQRIALFNNQDMELTSSEYEILLYFALNNGKVLSRDEIMHNTKGIPWVSFDRSVDVLVSRLRSKFKKRDNKKRQIIKTIHSVGYMFYLPK